MDPIRIHLTVLKTTAMGSKYWTGSVRKSVLPPNVDRPIHRWDKASSSIPAVFGGQFHPLPYHIYFQVFYSRWTSITGDYPERELDTDDSFKIYSRGHSHVAGDVSSSPEVQTSHKTSRREVRWKLDKNANNQSLESIVRCFEDYLEWVWASSADSSLRRLTASPHIWVPHHCPEYLREEITLTADVSRSTVVAYQYPNQSKICTICGQLVPKNIGFACVLCNQVFTTNHNLKSKSFSVVFVGHFLTSFILDHVNVHLGMKFHTCTCCCWEFTTQAVLQRHLKTCKGPAESFWLV